jgi:uncharacterized protein YukE
METGNKSSILASDMVPTWRKQISSAKSSIILVSPYLDDLVFDLLTKANVPASHITVLTDLAPSGNPKFYKKQLETLLKLKEIGYKIVALERVHAKLLITDNESISLGSQNFTRYGRQSKEVSAFDSDPRHLNAISEVLNWIIEANEISTDLIMKLLTEVNDEIKKAVNAYEDLESRIQTLIEGYVPTKVSAFQDWRKGLTSKLSMQIDELDSQDSNSTISATIKSITSPSTWDEYSSLLGNFWYLFQKNRVNTKEGEESFPLWSLSMYPILFSDTGTMGFARVGESRITYIRSNVLLDRVIADEKVNVHVEFPRSKDRVSNIKLSIDYLSSEAIQFDLIFDGQDLLLVGDNLADLKQNAKVKNDFFLNRILVPFWEKIEMLKSSEDWIQDVFADSCKPFTFDRLDRDHKNIEFYASGRNYRVAMVKFKAMSVLLAECTD